MVFVLICGLTLWCGLNTLGCSIILQIPNQGSKCYTERYLLRNHLIKYTLCWLSRVNDHKKSFSSVKSWQLDIFARKKTLFSHVCCQISEFSDIQMPSDQHEFAWNIPKSAKFRTRQCLYLWEIYNQNRKSWEECDMIHVSPAIFDVPDMEFGDSNIV